MSGESLDHPPPETGEPKALANRRKSRLSSAKFASSKVRADAPGEKNNPVGKPSRASRIDRGKFVSPKGRLDAAKFGSGTGLKVVKGAVKTKAVLS